jgi:hypothetical protein
MTPDLFTDGAPPPQEEKPAKKPRAKKAEAAPAPEAEVLPPQGSAEARASLIVAEAQENPVQVFTDEKRYSAFYERLAGTVRAHKPDVSTAKGRDEIRSLAFRVIKAKTSLDKAGLGLTEGWRKQIAAVNAARSKMTDELQELSAEVRKPLTEWEAAEEERKERVAAELERIRLAAIVGDEETSAEVEARGRTLYGETLDPALFQDRLDEAEAAKAASVQALAQAMHKLRKSEQDARELAELRAAEAERQRKAQEEADARALAPLAVELQKLQDSTAEAVPRPVAEAVLKTNGLPVELSAIVLDAAKPLWADHLRQLAEAEAAAKRAAEEAERQRAEELRQAEERAAQAARDAEAARIAEEREREEAKRREEEEERERQRKEADAERQRAHDAALEAERERAAQAEKAAEAARLAAKEAADRAEAERLEREEEAARAKAAKEEEEAAQKAREENKAHRRKIAGEAKADLIEQLKEGLDDKTLAALEGLIDRLAEMAILRIASRTIRHVTIQF